ncbi:hypothetical protein SAY87_003519 [Trapa incisa]|uniref:Pectinesterase n=1 Tax=Trapa incisa TaxID=236973 RepID=A0AAN7QJB0_9MYRT|nr:hypothetical protein SAY87_003519 [Trapa incisa]
MSDSDEKKKRLAVLIASSFMLVVIGTAVTVGLNSHDSVEGGHGTDDEDDSSHVVVKKKAVEVICRPTDFKSECVESLEEEAIANVTDPKELIKVSFTYTKQKLLEVVEQSAALKEAEKDPMASQALEICRDQVDLATYHLDKAFDRIGSLEVSTLNDVLSDLQTWLEAVLVFQETCFDEFENVTSSAVPQVKEALSHTKKFSDNALTMVLELNGIFESLKIPGFNAAASINLDADSPTPAHSRRLLQEDVPGHVEYPMWLDPVKRKLLAGGESVKHDLVIAQDGSGDFKTFKEAVPHLPVMGTVPFVVHVKAGTYKEKVNLSKDIWNIVWIGDDAATTKITFGDNFVDGVKTYLSATVTIVGQGHVFKNVGFENSAGAIKHQAVAVVIDGDMTAFHNCRFDGYQDTLYAHANRQFYRDCTITGTVDFIFGDPRALFQNCQILARRPMDGQQNMLTASGRENRKSKTAIVLHNCTIDADQSLMPVKSQFPTYLGRPWKTYSRTVYLQSFIGDLIHPDGWYPWEGSFALKTCYYAEYGNHGPGSDTAKRVKWPGIKHIGPTQAMRLTGGILLSPDQWVEDAGIPYTRSLV